MFTPINYEDYVNEYYQNLTDAAKPYFLEVMEKVKQIHSFAWFAQALMKLGKRDFVQWRHLFFYQPFIKEVEVMVADYAAAARKAYNDFLNMDSITEAYHKYKIPTGQGGPRKFFFQNGEEEC